MFKTDYSSHLAAALQTSGFPPIPAILPLLNQLKQLLNNKAWIFVTKDLQLQVKFNIATLTIQNMEVILIHSKVLSSIIQTRSLT